MIWPRGGVPAPCTPRELPGAEHGWWGLLGWSEGDRQQDAGDGTAQGSATIQQVIHAA